MNFCSAAFEASIKSETPATNGYEVSNLISHNRKGFMACGFIRPKVVIEITFKVPIDISYVHIGTRVGCHQSKGIEIFTKASHMKINKCGPKICKASGNIKDAINLPNTSTTSMKDDDDSELYYFIGKFFTESKYIIGRNRRYKHWLNVCSPPVYDESSMFLGNIRHANPLALNSVKKMQVKITAMVSPGPPCLSFLEVWGQPSMNCTPLERNNILQLWQQHQQRDFDTQQNIDSNIGNDEIIDLGQGKNNPLTTGSYVLNEIPEDFLDPLTCNIMKIPLLLPSGHSVDATSLERFISHEATWGRPPSNPFTGVAFNSTAKPIPNMSLKARIDRFLLSSGTSKVNDGNTLYAGVHNSNKILTSCLVSKEFPAQSQVSGKRKHDSEEKVKESNSEIICKLNGPVLNAPDDIDDDLDAEIERVLQSNSKYMLNTDNVASSSSGFCKSKAEITRYPLKVQDKTLNEVGVAKQSKLQSTSNTCGLDMNGSVKALGKFLNSIHQSKSSISRSYQNSSSTSSGVKNESSAILPRWSRECLQSYNCCKCGSVDANSAMYLLHCEHVMCRNCITIQHNAMVECATCLTATIKEAITRTHPNSYFT